MNWIRLQSEYFRHRKTLRLTQRLGEIAALYPLRLWTWAVEQSPDGSLRDIDAAELAIICGYSGDAPGLWAAMLECGFIEVERGKAQIRSWRDHQGKLIERAERNAGRMRELRSAEPVASATVPAPPAETPEPETIFPAALDTPAFRVAWSEWTAYRRERKLGKWAPRTVKAKLAELAALGEPAAIQSIRDSIGNGWHGLFAPKTIGAATNAAADVERLQAGGKIDNPAPVSIQSRLQRLADALPESLNSRDQWQAKILNLSGDSERIEAALGELDAEMVRDLRDMTNAETMAEIDATIRAGWERIKHRVTGETDAHTFRQTMEATLIRDHYGAPVLTLFGREAREAA